MNKLHLLIATTLVLLCNTGGFSKTNTTMKTQTQQLMTDNSYKTTLVVDQSAETVFKAITNVKGWWSENILGSTDALNSEFIYNYKDVHVCKLKITELVPDQKVVWLVLENHFNFTKAENEWKGNRIVFEISEENGKTRLDFTQLGLVPEYECYNVCNDAWTSYIQGSLKALIATGKGKPNTKENDLNKELIEKWGLPNDNQLKSAAMKKQNFTYSFSSPKTPEEIYAQLLDVRQWWSGLFGESFTGDSKKTGDEFNFKAGNGMHNTTQKLVEAVPGKRIVWLVTSSQLSFLSDPSEWKGTRICFDLVKDGKNTVVTFTHEGLVPQIECYQNCSSAWTGYLDNLKKALK